MPTMARRKVLNWASEIDDNTLEQAARSAALPFVEGHVALMPDAHLGYGATVGSVIPTRGTIIPSAIGVDIGCGMIAARLSLVASDLPDDLTPLLRSIEKAVPAGVGEGHDRAKGDWGLMIQSDRRVGELYDGRPWVLDDRKDKKLFEQYGTLGSGNHFVEVCLDETEAVWVVLHSGSRGIGNLLAQEHIEGAKGLMDKYFIDLEDPDLAYLVEGTQEFADYIKAMTWAQEYAYGNREAMMTAVLRAIKEAVGFTPEWDAWGRSSLQTERINCHHNYTARENHGGKNLWITRKGAIRARNGDLGVIPGSMGTETYIVQGLGNEASFCSASHGAGRRLSRGRAKRELSRDDFETAMEGTTWQQGKAGVLLDEAPAAYKDIKSVMDDQKDLVQIKHTLTQVLNYKGT